MQTKAKKAKAKLILFIVVILFLTGCKNNRDLSVKEKTDAQKETNVSLTDWKKDGLVVSDDVNVNELFYLNDFARWRHELDNATQEEAAVIMTGANDRYFWFLGVRHNENKEYQRGENAQYILDVYSSGNQKTKSIRFTPKDIGISGEIGYIVSVDVLGDDSYMFRWAEYEQIDDLYCQISDKIIFTDLNGNNIVDEFVGSFKEYEIEKYEQSILPAWPYESCHALSDDKVWVLTQFEKQALYIFSQQGELILQYESEKNERIFEPLITIDCEMILPVYYNDLGLFKFFYADTSGGSLKRIGEMKANPEEINKFYAMVDNDIYYQAFNPQARMEEGIVRWNIKTGERTWFLKYDVNGLMNYETGITFFENKPVCVYLSKHTDEGQKDYLVSVTDEKIQQDDDIIVADLVGGCSQVEKAAVNASMDSPDCQYKYIDVSSEEEKNRIMAELSQQKGPQIMFVPMDDYINMVEKNMLCDWYGIVDRSFFEDVLPAALLLGEKGNALYGLPVGIKVESMAVGQKEAGEWTLDLIMKLMEEGKINTSLRSPYIFEDYLEPLLTDIKLIEYMINDSFIIDWDEKTAHFDDTRFIRLLELTKEDFSDRAAEDTFEKELIWAYLQSYLDLMDYVSHGALDYTITGFPNHNKSGNYVVPAQNGMLVINSNISQIDKAAFYIENLFDNQIQLSSTNFCLGIKKMKVEDFVKTDYMGNKVYMNIYDTSKYSEEKFLALFDEAAAFLENCEPVPKQYKTIKAIIVEELSIMYANNRTPKETAGIINGRVQTYLQE